ncbi:hypothetical protein [Aquibium oceanicum]|uniref:hypothetical protein n=1 Tax=Aquibium oceanicum TaxID=1670800 RepID=UPI003620C727
MYFRYFQYLYDDERAFYSDERRFRYLNRVFCSLGGGSSLNRHVLGGVSSPPRVVQSAYDGNEGRSGQPDRHRSRDEHPQPPQGHFLLGLQIFAGFVFAVVGCYLFIEASDESVPRSEAARLNYIVAGSLSLALSVFLIALINFVLF